MKGLAGMIGIGCLGALALARADEAGLARLAEARELWRGTAVGDYRLTYQKYCECKREAPPVTAVTVSEGRVERVYHVHADSDREVPAREDSLDLYWTVDELFAKLASAYENDATVRVEYDPARGYPTRLLIDYNAGITGDETDLRGMSVVP